MVTLRPLSRAGGRLAQWTSLLLVLTFSSTTSAFSTFSGTVADFSHLVNDPDDYATWLPDTTLTYRFDASFDAVWPNPLIKNQVRVAFNQWSTANVTPDGAVYSYGRSNGWQPFGDIRSVVIHELGHVLGMHHPDQAHDAGRNWAMTGVGLVAQADLNNELMRSWINPGDYNHLLSHDELDAFDYMYGTALSFSETSSSSADIVISAYNPGNPNNWAEGGWSGVYRNGSDVAAGMRATSGFVHLNQASGSPLGFRSLGINWDYQNAAGKPTRSFAIQTTGTDYTSPLYHYDNNGPYHFNNLTTNWVDADHKDDLLHRWTHPEGGDIPDSEVIHVGLEQDVWDWSVVSAEVGHPDGTSSTAPLLGFHEWSNTVVVGTPAAATGDVSSGTLDTGGEIKVLARGFEIIPSAASNVYDLMFAQVTDLNLQLEDLNRRTLEELREKQRVEEVKDFGTRLLEPGKSFVIVLEGEKEDLPPELQETGNYLLLHRPELLQEEVMVYAGSQDEEQGPLVGTFALLGTPPITGNLGPWLTGDYDLNGVVDVDDYRVWKRNFSAEPKLYDNLYQLLTADGNQNGRIDLGDYTIWRNHLGASLAGFEPADASIPEPGTGALVLLVIGAVAVAHRGRYLAWASVR